MEMSVSRRTFLKGAAAMAAAASLSALLTACGDSYVARADMGEYIVELMSVDLTTNNGWDSREDTFIVVPRFKFKNIEGGINSRSYSSVFSSASIDGTELKLMNGSDNIFTMQSLAAEAEVKPCFISSDVTAYSKFYSGAAPLLLTVKLGGLTRVFSVNYAARSALVS